MKTWFFSDPHIGHENILKFKTNEGSPLRPFGSIEEHDWTLLNNYNSLVKPEDRVYWMGDCAMHRRNVSKIGEYNGRKKLIKGNHDIFKLKDYTPFFEDVLSYRVYPEFGMIVSHIPVHPCQLEGRFKFNVHGHTHSNMVKVPNSNWISPLLDSIDERYINLCVEHTNWSPVNMDDLLKRINNHK